MLAALAFVPPDKVPNAYDSLVATAFFEHNENMLRPFLNYFESTWISSYDRRRNRRDPIFDVTLWNCYQSVLDGLGKTNNACEGFNRAVNSMLGAAHPTIFKLLDSLKKQQELTRAKIEQILAGNADAQSREKYIRRSARLLKLVSEYDGKNLEYLKGVANSIKYRV